MSLTCREISAVLEAMAPPELAENWDHVGLQVGSLEHPVDRLLVCLEVRPSVVEEAVALGAQMLLSHHPLIWRPLTALRSNHPDEALLLELVQRRLNVFVMHTNWDKAPEGVNACLARALGLVKVEVLQEAREELWFKLVTFVPVGYESKVRDALAEAGAGVIGAYSHCSYRALGTGTFRPMEGASPFIGAPGQMEEVEELRLEMLVPRRNVDLALRYLRETHPYEEVAYDVYPVANRPSSSGLGRIGELEEPLSLGEFAEAVKKILEIDRVRMTGEPERLIRKVAVCGGSGGDLVAPAGRRGAEVLVTGDLKHHQALEAQNLGLAVLDAGHWATERVSLPFLAQALRSALPDLEVLLSSKDCPPWRHW